MFSSSPLPSPSELISRHFPCQKYPSTLNARGKNTSNFIKASSLVRDDVATKALPGSATRNDEAISSGFISTSSGAIGRSVDTNVISSERSTCAPRKSNETKGPRITKASVIDIVGLKDGENPVTERKIKNQTAPSKSQARGVNGHGPTDKEQTLPKSKKPGSIQGKAKVRGFGEENTASAQSKPTDPPSAHIAVQPNDSAVVDASFAHLGRLDLEAALKRRRGWTPPPEARDLGSPTKGDTFSNSEHEADTSFRNISSFLSDYGCDADNSVRSLASDNYEGITTKRRKVELLASGYCSTPKVTRPPQKKLPKKQPTITAKATAPFIPENNQQETGLTQYFSLLTPDSSDPNNKCAVSSKYSVDKNDKPVATKKKATRKPVTKTKESRVNHKPVLLPPKEAVASANEQPFIFGTSSQLARDHSPTMIRDIQRAIADSEANQCDESLSSEPLTRQTGGRVVGTKKLWTAAARDLNDEVQVPDSALSALPDINNSHTAVDLGDDTFEQNGRGDTVPNVQIPNLQPNLRHDIDSSDLSIPRCLADASTRVRRSSISPVKKSRKKQELDHTMPEYHGFSHTELGKEVARFGFKPIRKREEMVALLQRCWESTHRTALGNLSPNRSLHGLGEKTISTEGHTLEKGIEKKSRRKVKARLANDTSMTISEVEAANTSPKTRGRPRKKPIVEGPTKETLPATANAAKVKRAASPKNSASSTSITLMSENVSSILVHESDSKPSEVASRPLYQTDPDAMSLKITEAVTSEPATNDPDDLSFFEKMLIYQPIVIEDLTTWLNVKGLSKVGVDEEIPSGLVKAWCEGRSVCCLWRENLRGRKRARC